MKDIGKIVEREIESEGGVEKELNKIEVDEGIEMGNEGMIY